MRMLQRKKRRKSPSSPKGSPMAAGYQEIKATREREREKERERKREREREREK